MSVIRSIRFGGRSFDVDPVHRTVFKIRYPKEYQLLEDSEFAIPPTLYVAAPKEGLHKPPRLFFTDLGLVPVVVSWDAKSKAWKEVKH